VHNAHVVAELEAEGAVFVEELDAVPAGSWAVLAAHGVAPAIRTEAAARDLQVIDATCPLVAKVHQEVRRYAADGYTVALIGHGDHEEVVGTVGEAPDRVHVVADEAEAAALSVDDPTKVGFVMQTTLAVDEAERIAGVLRSRFPTMRAPLRDDICYATSNRQRAITAVAGESDLVLVVGSRNSSNSVRLVEVAERAGTPARLIDDAGDIDPAWLTGARSVAVTAGASAPPHLVDEVVTALGGFGRIDLTERTVADEILRFMLPKEVS
jgi:4-hydroxy-3-methylbut-2-enyl diphosphate reductase